MLNRRDFLISTGITITSVSSLLDAQGNSSLPLDLPDQIIRDSMVGRGIDTVLDNTKNDIFKKPKIVNITYPPYEDKDFFDFSLAQSQLAFTKSTSFSAKSKGSYGLGKAKAKGSIKTFFNSNSYSCYLVGFFKKVAEPFEVEEPIIRPDILKFIKRNINNPLKIERQLGNEVIIGFQLGAELIVVAEFQAYSEKNKRDIVAQINVSTTGQDVSISGSRKYAQAIRSATESKNKTIKIFGHIPDSKVDLISEDQLIKYLTDFSTDYRNRLRVSSYITREFKHLNGLIDYDFVNKENLRIRDEFGSSLNSLYQSYEDWLADIKYVLDDIKRDEFETAVIDTARTDKEVCEKGLDRAALKAWEESPNWKPEYDLRLLDGFKTEFPIYKQKQTPVKIVKPRRPKQRIDRGRNDHGGGGRW